MPVVGADGGATLARLLADRLFSRVAGAAPVEGNAVRLLRDGADNYPAWLAAIASAQRYVHFENYIIRDDEVGRRFTAALAAKAREGVAVRLLYDWMGSFGTPRRVWRGLREAGVEVRSFNRPRLDSPFGWLSRNHRKTVGVDGRIGFVSGLCVGDAWEGDLRRGVAPWRDTGIEIAGPAVADLDEDFSQSWVEAGGHPPPPPPAHGAGLRQAAGPGGEIYLTAVPDGEGVRVSVRDTGPGVPPELTTKIFDPFFTTKDVGEGTGLGLAISQRIVRSHGGRIELGAGEPGAGAEFIVWLPLEPPAEAPREAGKEL